VSIREVPMYQVVCDRCGKHHGQDSEYAGWESPASAEDMADESEWEHIDEKHCCPDCWEWAEDEETIVFKPPLEVKP